MQNIGQTLRLFRKSSYTSFTLRAYMLASVPCWTFHMSTKTPLENEKHKMSSSISTDDIQNLVSNSQDTRAFIVRSLRWKPSPKVFQSENRSQNYL